MIVFQVKVNGQIVSVAGAGEYGVLFTDVIWSRRNPAERPKGWSKKGWDKVEMSLRTTGGTFPDASTGEHLQWREQQLSVGDKIEIRVLDHPKCDEPIERHRYNRPKTKRSVIAKGMKRGKRHSGASR